MGDQIQAQRPRPLVEEYKRLLEELESLDRALLERGWSKDAVFIDNMILRLKVWAADIDIAGGALDSVDDIGLLAAQVRLRLDEIKSQCDAIRKVSGEQHLTLVDYKDQFAYSVDSLTAFAEPLKTLRTPSRDGKIDTTSKINTHLRESAFYPKTWAGNWVLLDSPLPVRYIPILLGSVVASPTAPVNHYAPDVPVMGNFPADMVIHDQPDDFHIQGSSSQSARVKSLLESYFNSEGNVGGHSSASEIKGPELHRRAILNASRVFDYLLQQHKGEVNRLMSVSKQRTAFMVTGVMSASDQAVHSMTSKDRQSQGPSITIPPSAISAVPIAETPRSYQSYKIPAQNEKSVTHDHVGEEAIFALQYRIIKRSRFLKGVNLQKEANSKRITGGTIMY
jgi:hypothetical protein